MRQPVTRKWVGQFLLGYSQSFSPVRRSGTPTLTLRTACEFTMQMAQASPHAAAQRPKKIVITRDLGPQTMARFQSPSQPEGGEELYDLVVWPEDSPCSRSWLISNAKGADALIVLLTDQVNAELLDAAGSNLKVVSTMSVGYEHINVHELAMRGIKLGYTPDVLTDAVADVSIMLALMAGRLAKETTAFVQEGKWPTLSWSPFTFCGTQLSTTPSSPKRTAGFVGFGRIARATLKRLSGFGLTHCLYSTRPTSPPTPTVDAMLAKGLNLTCVKRVSMEVLAEESDVIFVCVPGGNETKGLVADEFLRRMKSTAVLVNTARGGVVDENSLARAVREKWIWGAGVDVVLGEPDVGREHALVREPRCVVLPHVGSATVQTREDMASLAAMNALVGVGTGAGGGEKVLVPAFVDLERYK